MPSPTAQRLTADLLAFLERTGVQPYPRFTEEAHPSGVYAVLNCVFSAQANFERVVLPALRRFGPNSGLHDTPNLRFSDFVQYVQGGQAVPDETRYREVAEQAFNYRGVLSGRLKVQVAYDVCQFFIAHGLETRQDVQALPQGAPYTCEHPGTPGRLEELVMHGLVNNQPPGSKVRGMGLALGAYLMICLGNESYVKPDSLLLRLMGEIGGWSPRAGNEADFTLIRQAVSCVAAQKNATPASLDNALWRFESTREARRTAAIDRMTWSSPDEVTITPPSKG